MGDEGGMGDKGGMREGGGGRGGDRGREGGMEWKKEKKGRVGRGRILTVLGEGECSEEGEEGDGRGKEDDFILTQVQIFQVFHLVDCLEVGVIM